MATELHYSRTQWASGQGFFHSGTVRLGDRSVLYVYDCGSLDRVALTREISIFRDRHGDEIDLLFLSHFHADHVNGLPDLLAGTRVHTAVIPLVPIAERLFVFARALATDEPITDWYRDLIADPVSAIADISNGAEVVEVAPEVQEDDDDSLELPYEPVAPADLTTGTSADDFSDTATLTPGARSVLTGSNGTLSTAIWEWDTMTTAFAAKRKESFLDTLATQLKITRADLNKRLSTRTGVVDLLTNHRTALEASYNSNFADLNLTSLLLYSGPAAEVPSEGMSYRARSVVERGELHAWDVRPGWLGTGDQRMGVRRCSETVQRFGARLGRVGALALPHHGARDSFHPALLAAFGDHRPVCSASVGAHNTYHHPNRRVIIDVSSNGNHVVVVTEQESSRWTESGVTLL